jgi:glycosyltransferase involved in cell wall biosynthesis
LKNIDQPFFSIIIPTFNRKELLIRSVQSILNQTFGDFEIIVVDDGSTDGTRDAVRQLKATKIYYYFKANQERAIARNYGIKKAKGHYITFLDSDDRMFPYSLSLAYECITSKNYPEWFHYAYQIETESGKILRKINNRKGDIGKSLLKGNHLSCIGVFVRSDIMSTYRFPEEPSIIGSEDYLLWLKISRKFRLTYSNKIGGIMTQHVGRSELSYNRERIINRINDSINYVKQCKDDYSLSAKELSIFIAHRYLFLSNALLEIYEQWLSMNYFMKSINENFSILANKTAHTYLPRLFRSFLR